MTDKFKPRNLRIYRHVTRTRILVIEDALNIGKLRIELTEYRKGQGVVTSLDHYLDIDTARLLFNDLVFPDEHFVLFMEFKGSVRNDQARSRVFKVEWDSRANKPIKLGIAHGPGRLSNTGAIMPVGKPEHFVATLLDVQNTRKIALAVLEHLQAWATATYHARLSSQTWREGGVDSGHPTSDICLVDDNNPTSFPAFDLLGSPLKTNGHNGDVRAKARIDIGNRQAADQTTKTRKAAEVTAFWEYAFGHGMEKADVYDILRQHDDDFFVALAALKNHVGEEAGA